MLTSILDTIATELQQGVEKLKLNVTPSSTAQQRCISETLEDILKTGAGSDLLLKYQMSLAEMRDSADEGARLANLCSTRMGRAQQMCKERADAVIEIDSFLRNSTDVEKKIRDLNRQVDKLVRFCNQTEQAMTHLQALNIIQKTEEEVDLIRQQAKSAVTIINMEPSPSILAVPTSRPGDDARQAHEEVMLEEFLSNDKP